MPNVWILNHYADTLDGASNRHYFLAKWLKSFGWNASVIAASTKHNDSLNQSKMRQGRAVHDDVEFCWIPASPYQGNGLSRIRNMVQYSRRAKQDKYIKDLPRPDAVIGSSVHPLAAKTGLSLAKRFSVPFVFEVRDLWPQTLIDFGQISANGIAAKLLGRLEKSLYRQANAVVTLLPKAEDYIRGLNIDTPVEWISNGADISDLEYTPLDEVPPRTGPMEFMYFGAHGQPNGLDFVLQALGQLKNENRHQGIRMRFIGDGAIKGQLQSMASSLGLIEADMVEFLPPVSKREIPTLASTADAFVLSVRDMPKLYRYGISMNKLFDYMAAGRPILMASSAVNNPVEDARAGLSSPAENVSALAENFRKLCDMKLAERIEMGKNAREHVKANYSYQALARKLANLLDRVSTK